MHPLLCPNVKGAFRRLGAGNAVFASDFIDVVGTPPQLLGAVQSVTNLPLMFRLPDGAYGCAQEPDFGFYALRRILRGIYQATSYVTAAQVLTERGILGPSIATSYTAAYHLLHSYLALEGLVVVNSCRWHSAAEADEEEWIPEAFMAKLTKNNLWIFESRTRSHKQRWGEVVQCYAQTKLLPICFEDLFQYLMGPIPVASTDLAEHLPQLLERLAQVRHEALYSSLGADPYVLDELWNTRGASSFGIETQARVFFEFAVCMMRFVTDEAHPVMTQLRIARADVAGLVTYSFLTPDFDHPRTASLPQDLRERVSVYWSWLATVSRLGRHL